MMVVDCPEVNGHRNGGGDIGVEEIEEVGEDGGLID